MLLPLGSMQKVVITAYEETSNGIRPRTVYVWGIGRWDDAARHGEADLQVSGGSWAQGTPCTHFATACPSGATDADGYCTGTGYPTATLCLRGARAGQTGADFSIQAQCRYDQRTRHERLYVVVTAEGRGTDCEGIALPEPPPPGATPPKLRLPPRPRGSWRHVTNACGTPAILE